MIITICQRSRLGLYMKFIYENVRTWRKRGVRNSGKGDRLDKP
jgi:hypothetical protein